MYRFVRGIPTVFSRWVTRIASLRARVDLPGYLRRDLEWWFDGESRIDVEGLADLASRLPAFEVDQGVPGGPHPLEIERSGRGVCRHRAKWTFRKLVELGYEARYVSGTQAGSRVPHTWAAVRLDGKWWAFETMAAVTESCLREPSQYRPSHSIGFDTLELHVPTSLRHTFRLLILTFAALLDPVLRWLTRQSEAARGLSIFLTAMRRRGATDSLCWPEPLLDAFHPDEVRDLARAARSRRHWSRSVELCEQGVSHRLVFGFTGNDPDNYDAMITHPAPGAVIDDVSARPGFVPVCAVEPLTGRHFVYSGFERWVVPND